MSVLAPTSPASTISSPRPRVLLLASSRTRFHRDIVYGMIAYVHQRTNWRLICHEAINPRQQQRLEPAGVLSVIGDPAFGVSARRLGTPFVLAGNPYRDPQASAVSSDESALSAMAAEYLAGLGLRHFAFIGHGPWPFVAQRLAGFTKALLAMGHAPPASLQGVLYDRRRRPRFERQILQFLQALPCPCGVLAANDAIGTEIISACQTLGLRVPEDIAVLGVDDDELACELSEVPLSSVAQPLHAIGYEAARLLHQHMDDPAKPPTELFLPPLRVVPRASTDLIALDDADVVSALRLIGRHYAEPINVDWVVRQLPVARRSLERRFKALVGRTLLEQLHHVRLRSAKELLAESDLGLKVIAERCGFVNARWMADTFRRELGTTPIRYRRQFRTEG